MVVSELGLPDVSTLDAPLPIRHAEIADAARWQSLAAELAATGARLVAMWGRDDDATAGGARISAAYALTDGLLWLDLVLGASTHYPDIARHFPHAARMQRVQLRARRCGWQHRDTARAGQRRHAVEHAGVVGAVETRLHQDDAVEPEPLQHCRELCRRRVHRRVGTVAGEGIARLRSDDVDVAVGGACWRKWCGHRALSI